MELINNLLQFLAALLGFGLAGIWYWKKRSQAYFLLTCFYGCFTLGALYWTLYLLLFSKTPQVFMYQSLDGSQALFSFAFCNIRCPVGKSVLSNVTRHGFR